MYKKKHDPKTCERFNAKFSIASQIEIWKRQDARSKGAKEKDRERSNAAKSESKTEDEDVDPEDKWSPTKGTMVVPPKAKKANHLRCSFLIALDAAESSGDSIFPASTEPPKLERSMAAEEFVRFTLDTGTETGTVDKRDRHLLSNVREDHCTLLGVSGTVDLKEIGSYIFGNARVLGDSAGRNLVNFAEAGPSFQLINPDPQTLILQGWPGTPLHATKFYFIQDEDQFGDRLFHCSMPKSVWSKVQKKAVKFERNYSFYRPIDKGASQDFETSTIELVESMHVLYNHASANQLIRILEHGDHRESLSADDVLAWKELRGDLCTGCIAGKMKHHSHKPSTNEAKGRFSGVGDGAGDLMFVDRPSGPRTPAYVHLDRGTKFVFIAPMLGKSIEHMQSAIQSVMDKLNLAGKRLQSLTFDRESAISASAEWIESKGVKLYLKASGQKVGDIEVTIRYIREDARSVKAGVHDDFGYGPPPHWNMDLLRDVVNVRNLLPREGQDCSPYQLMLGHSFDCERGLRVRWGEPVLCKRPPGIASDLRASAQWGVIVYRYMDGSGVVKVYMVETKKYAFRLNFKRGKVPGWVVEELDRIRSSGVDRIGFEDDLTTPEAAEFTMGSLISVEDPELEVPKAVADIVSGRLPELVEDARGNAINGPVGEYLRDSGIEEGEIFLPPPLDEDSFEEAVPVERRARKNADDCIEGEVAHIRPALAKRESKAVVRLAYTGNWQA